MMRDAAVITSRKLLELSADVDRSIGDLMRTGCSGSQFAEYRQLGARIMGNLYLHMLKPIFDEYPDLQPTKHVNGAPGHLPRETAERILTLMDAVTLAIHDVHGMLGKESNAFFDEGADEVYDAVADVAAFIQRYRPDRD